MQILERDSQLAQLRERLAAVASQGEGACVVVSGEAGIGKTTLVRQFCAGLPARMPLLACGCEALYTPRPLGPLVDLAQHLPPSLAHALQAGQTGHALFPALLAHFAAPPHPRVLVVEDVHWADAGTLDLLRYLGRRVRALPLLLLLTHRDDALDSDHPLRCLLGELPSSTTVRLPLPVLSRAATRQLARAAQREPEAVIRASGGNPFYVTELLASVADGVPPSVRDAVLGRLARVSPAARRLAQAVSLFPGRAERAVLEAIGASTPEAVDECLRRGLLQADGAALVFRHEIARNAVHDDLPASVRADGHAAVLQALATAGPAAVGVARLVHHAEAAGRPDEVARLAPGAAREAAAGGDHREAARLYGIALAHAPASATAELAALLEARAHECMLVNRQAEAIDCRERAMAWHEQAGHALDAAVNLRWLARLHWFEHGSSPLALALGREAIERLEALPLHRERALACSSLSHICLGGDDLEGAQHWGLRAIELAEALDDVEALCQALTNVGAARLRRHDDAMAWERLHRALTLALENGFEADAARAYNNLFLACIVHREFALGLEYAQAGIAFCEARGIDVFTVRIRIRRAFAHILMGQWELADADLADVAGHHTPSPMEAATRDFVAAVLALRRGVPGAVPALHAAIDAMQRQRAGLWFTSTAAALAEVAWLEGDAAGVELAVRPALATSRTSADRWSSGELAVWLRRAGTCEGAAGPGLAEPHALELRGDHAAAGAAWNRLGCPYDRALALAGGDERAQRQALVVFEALGAAPAAERVRQTLRERGARGVPRGPQPRTRDDPLGLTVRERQVFELARAGLSVPDISRRLHRSERTVEHHVAAVYRKLGVRTRSELIARHPDPN